MKSTDFKLIRYDADDGFVFDWKVPRFHTELDAKGNEYEVQDHLYAKTLFIGETDSIDNYMEVSSDVLP